MAKRGIYVAGRALWSSATQGHPGARVFMQGDGNLVVYASSGAALWNSGTGGSSANRLEVQDDANLVLYGSAAVWSSGTSNPRLLQGEQLLPGQSLWSSSRRFLLAMQTEGNLVLYDGGTARWHAGTYGHPGAFAVMQTDGNLVVYLPSGSALWASGTGGSGGQEAVVQDDGNFVIYKPGAAVWNTGTVAGAPGAPPRRPGGDDYPADCANISGEDCRTAPLDAYVDRWAFYSRECTSFVAWRMNRDHGAGAFHNLMRGGRWGNAGDWDDNATRLGYQVTATPRVGAIAQWNGNEIGGVGHVAYVSEVHPDGRVTVEEYNYGTTGRYGVRGPLRAPRYIYFP